MNRTLTLFLELLGLHLTYVHGGFFEFFYFGKEIGVMLLGRKSISQKIQIFFELITMY